MVENNDGLQHRISMHNVQSNVNRSILALTNGIFHRFGVLYHPENNKENEEV